MCARKIFKQLTLLLEEGGAISFPTLVTGYDLKYSYRLDHTKKSHRSTNGSKRSFSDNICWFWTDRINYHRRGEGDRNFTARKYSIFMFPALTARYWSMHHLSGPSHSSIYRYLFCVLNSGDTAVAKPLPKGKTDKHINKWKNHVS